MPTPVNYDLMSIYYNILYVITIYYWWLVLLVDRPLLLLMNNPALREQASICKAGT